MRLPPSKCYSISKVLDAQTRSSRKIYCTSFPLRIFPVHVTKPQFPAELVSFTEEILNGKHTFCAVIVGKKKEINEKQWDYFSITILSPCCVQINEFTFTCYYCLLNNVSESPPLIILTQYLCYKHAETKMQIVDCKLNVDFIKFLALKISRKTARIVGLVYSRKIAYLQIKLPQILDIVKIFTVLHTTTI